MPNWLLINVQQLDSHIPKHERKLSTKNINVFELRCCRRLLIAPWTVRRSTQSVLKEISPDNSLERLAETSILCPPDAKSQLIRKDLDAGKDWRQEEKGMTEDDMVGWHHRLNGREFQQASGVGDGQRSLVCCSPWGCKESDMLVTEQQITIIMCMGSRL